MGVGGGQTRLLCELGRGEGNGADLGADLSGCGVIGFLTAKLFIWVF